MAVDPKRDAQVDRDGSSCVTSKIDYGPQFDMQGFCFNVQTLSNANNRFQTLTHT